jgi:hypothetical protein
MTLRRYLTGVDGAGWNLDSGVEWWWTMAITPMAVWTIGSLAFAGAIALAVREVAWPRTAPVPRAAPAAR